MDDRRWSTAEVLMYGVLNRPVPERSQPDGLDLVKVDEDDLSAETIRAGLEAGGIKASQYYGVWSIWKAGDGYDGELLQYHAVTDSIKGVTLDEAVEKARYWGKNCTG